MVYLGKGGGQFSTARSGTGHDDQGFIGFDIFIGAVSLIADDQIDIRRIPLGVLMGVNPNVSSFQFMFKLQGRRLVFKTGNYNS